MTGLSELRLSRGSHAPRTSLNLVSGLASRSASGLASLMLCTLALTSFNAAAATRAIVIAGLGGNVEYNQAFDEQTGIAAEALQTITASGEHVVYLQAGDASRESVLDTIDALVQEVGQLKETDDAIDTFVLVMMGHGNVNRDGWKFNLSGPDLSTSDLVGALAPLEVARQVIVASTSASGALLQALSQPGRTVITATKNGGELNAVRFTEYFTQALASDAADVDRNELLSVEEAFIFANNLTVRYYEEQKLLASEHARLEGGDATSVTLAALGALRDAQDNPAVASLLDERAILESSFYEVKARKSSMADADYYAELEAVLIDIANLQQKIDSLIGNGS